MHVGKYCVLLLILAATSALPRQRENKYKSYRGHSVLRLSVGNTSDLDVLRKLKRRHAGMVDIWKQPTEESRQTDIRVHPSILSRVFADLDKSQSEYNVLVRDIESLIENERGSRNKSASQKEFNLFSYHTFDEVINWIDSIVEKCGSECSTHTIGTTFEGRPLKVIQIGRASPGRTGIWIDAGLHAREWIAPATALVIIDKLINGYDSDHSTRHMLNNTTWYILPVANPDGYHHTWTEDRLWRKNRARFAGSPCVGVDVNRNWDFHWGEGGASDDKCSDTYKGDGAFSEAESFSIATFIYSLRSSLKLYIALHSHGQLWLTPWGYTKHLPHDYTDLIAAAVIGNNALRSTYGTEYRVGSASQLLYLASGSSDDWAKAVAGVKYAYTIELRDGGKYGFILPARYILPTATETYNGIKEMITRKIL